MSRDIREALSRYKASGKDSLLSCVLSKRFFWSSDGQSLNYDYKTRPRRQDFYGTPMENGAIYINTVRNIRLEQNRLGKDIEIYLMPEYTSLELDSSLDWTILEIIASQKLSAQSRDILIKLFATDIDGVLTDGGMYYSESGDETKCFNTRDAVGLRLLSEAGIQTALITSENCELNKRRAEKIHVDYLFQDVKDKLSCMNRLCERLSISLGQVAYIGDDINDIELLSAVGLKACPSDALERVKIIKNIHILKSVGGQGVVREFAEEVLKQ
jgi:N-acylneuraminate cytidylyltransferase